MPKSKRRPPHRKDKKIRVTQSSTEPAASPADTVTQTGVLKTQQTIQPKPTTATGRSALTGAARHPFVAGELKRIGILTGIVIVVLVALAFALPRFI